MYIYDHKKNSRPISNGMSHVRNGTKVNTILKLKKISLILFIQMCITNNDLCYHPLTNDVSTFNRDTELDCHAMDRAHMFIF